MREPQGSSVHYYLSRLLSKILILLIVLFPLISIADHSDAEWLALNIYHEVRGENWAARAAVALVTINRVESHKYPNTMKEVVTQPRQFSWYWDGKSNKPKDYHTYEECLFISKSMIYLWENGFLKKYINSLNLDGVKWYHNSSVKPGWSSKKELIGMIGDHHFYR